MFDGTSSRAWPVTARIDNDALILVAEHGERRAPLSALVIDPPLGGLRRVVKLPGDVRFETDDHALVASIEERLGRNRGITWVNRLERRWPVALWSVILVVAAGFGFVRYGLPVAAHAAANATPHAVLDVLDRQTLAVIERHALSPTRLRASRRAALQKHFERITRDIGGAYKYRLLFRESSLMGANAFALPGGTVVVTDDLVHLARNDEEILAVLAHEVGHVTERHGARSVYQSVGVLMFMSLITGDVASATTMAGTLSATLIENGYSREMETEADQVAGRYLVRTYGTTKPLRDILTRLSAEHGDLPALLSTHPGGRERLRVLMQLEQLR